MRILMMKFFVVSAFLLPLSWVSQTHAQSSDYDEAMAQRVHMAVQTLRDLIRPTERRVVWTARELVKMGPGAYPVLVDLAEDPVPAVRQASIRALSGSGDQIHLPVFVQALADAKAEVVVDAVDALRPIASDWVTRSLVRYLGHRDPRVRHKVLAALDHRPVDVVYTIVRKLLLSPPVGVGRGPYLAALGRYPDDDTLADLIKSLDLPKLGIAATRGLAYFGPQSASPAVRWLTQPGQEKVHVAAALCTVLAGFESVGPAGIREVVARASIGVKRVAIQAQLRVLGKTGGVWLTELTGHKDGKVRQVALEAMLFTEGGDPLRHLKQNLWHKRREVRMLSAQATARVSGGSSVLDALIRRYRHLGVRRKPANMEERGGLLGSVAHVGGQVAVSELIHALGYDDEAQAAIAGLGVLGTSAVRSLLFVIKTDDMKRGPHAVRALARVGREAFEPMVQLLSHANMEVRNIARRALSEMRATAVVPEIVALVENPASLGRKKLMALLGRLPCKASLDALVGFARNAAKHDLRLAAVKALSKLPHEDVITALRSIAKDDSSNEVRLWAVQTLIGRGDRGSVPIFKKMLSYEKPFIKQACAFGIGYLGSPPDIVGVSKQLLNPRPFVLRAVRDSLRRLSYRPGLKYGEQFSDWLEDYQDRDTGRPVLRKATMRLSPVSTMTYWLGGEEGDPLLILHGGPDLDHRYLRPGYDRLAESRVLFYVDLPGRGESQLDQWPKLGVDADAEAVALLLAKLNIRNIDVLAHEWGAHVAVRLAEKYPKLVRRLVLDNPAAPTFSGWLADVQVAENGAQEPWRSDIQLMKNPLPLFFPEIRDRFSTLGLMVARMADVSQMVHVAPFVSPDLRFRSAMLETMGTFDFGTSYAEVRKETLIINGKETPSLPVVLVNPEASAKEKSETKGVHWTLNLALGNKKIHVTTIPDAGLFPALENPEMFVNAVTSFLR